jgi:hypothetical protein
MMNRPHNFRGGPVSLVGVFLYSRFFMADYADLNVETLGKTLRKQASGFRQLADKILDGDFRSRLIELALDYDCQAAKLGHVDLPEQ